jgi:hypothetical protein
VINHSSLYYIGFYFLQNTKRLSIKDLFKKSVDENQKVAEDFIEFLLKLKEDLVEKFKNKDNKNLAIDDVKTVLINFIKFIIDFMMDGNNTDKLQIIRNSITAMKITKK